MRRGTPRHQRLTPERAVALLGCVWLVVAAVALYAMTGGTQVEEARIDAEQRIEQLIDDSSTALDAQFAGQPTDVEALAFARLNEAHDLCQTLEAGGAFAGTTLPPLADAAAREAVAGTCWRIPAWAATSRGLLASTTGTADPGAVLAWLGEEKGLDGSLSLLASRLEVLHGRAHDNLLALLVAALLVGCAAIGVSAVFVRRHRLASLAIAAADRAEVTAAAEHAENPMGVAEGTTVTWSNPAFDELLGAPASRRSLVELAAANPGAMPLLRLLESPPGENGGHVAVTTGGRTRDLNVTVTALPATARRGPALLLVASDLTERERLAAKAQEAAARLDLVLDRVRAIFFVSGLDGKVEWVSANAEKVWGITADEMVRNPYFWRETVLPEDCARLEAALAAGTAIGVMEFRIRMPDGAMQWMQSRTTLRRDAEGRPTGLLGVCEDITERKSLEDAKTQFIRTAAHELRTPLTPLLLQLPKLQAAPGLTPSERDGVEAIARSASRLRDVVESVVTIARIQTGHYRPTTARVDAALAVQEALTARRPTFAGRGIAVTEEVAPGIHVTGHHALLRQVVDQLLSNAAKFTPSGGTVRVRLAADGGDAIITVADTGAGITRERLPDLFRPFGHAHAVDQDTNPATGLGLYTSQLVLGLFGGTITAESPGLGRGSTFTCRIPLAASDIALHGGAPRELAQPPAAR